MTDWIVADGASDEPRYAISVVAARCGVRTATLRRYEEWGLLEPARSGRRRLYSEADIERVLRIRRLVDDLGVNLAGAAAVLHLAAAGDRAAARDARPCASNSTARTGAARRDAGASRTRQETTARCPPRSSWGDNGATRERAS